jgi:hypothetical protein
MKLTIIVSDGSVYKDGLSYSGLDFSLCGIPSEVSSLQWNNGQGWIEFYSSLIDNQAISELPEWATACVAKWDATDYAIKNPPTPTPEQLSLANKMKAEGLLSESDWSVLPDVNLVNKSEWQSYRSVLRQIAINPTPDATFPVAPQSVW